MNLPFVIEVTIGGLLSGVMYSLVALGFVLIYKASGVFNFAQGSMVLFAPLSFVGQLELGVPVWLAVLLTIAITGRSAGSRVSINRRARSTNLMAASPTIGGSRARYGPPACAPA
jgi:branched-subunit amino acid ABC-type transport system permease component